MITTVNATGKTSVKYGRCEMLVSEDGTLEVPAYVAKSLVSIPGVTCSDDLSASVPSMLDGIAEGSEFEANYFLVAYGVAVPDAGVVQTAKDLFTAKGNPSVSAV